MTNDLLEQAVKIAKELEQRKATNRMKEYKPYEYQTKFHNTVAQQQIFQHLFQIASIESNDLD